MNIIKEIKKSESIGNTIYSEIPKQDKFLCKVCCQRKNKEHFYKYIRTIDNINIIKEEYIKNYCKDCLPVEAISLTNNNIKIDKSIIYELFYNRQLDKLKKDYGLTIDDLISRKDAAKQLNINLESLRSWFQLREEIGLVNPIYIISHPGNFKEKGEKLYLMDYTVYYKLEEFNILKQLTQDGYFQLRTEKIIRQGEEAVPNAPYIYITKKNKEYLYVNLKENKKPCSLCLNIKNFNEFYNSNSTYDKLSTFCKECSNKKAIDRYNLLTLEEKQDTLKKIKEWKDNNKDKIKSYKEYSKRKPQNKVYRNARRRLNDIINRIKDSIWAEYLKNNPNTSKIEIKEIGCSFKEFILYIESKFIEDMSWENYGPGYKVDNKGKPIYNENNNIIKLKQWQIDHIKPVSSFDFDDVNEVKKINYYTNLLPMWAEDNNYKSNKDEFCPIFDKEFLEKYKELEILTKKYKKEIENEN
jgi:hypothetical protein